MSEKIYSKIDGPLGLLQQQGMDPHGIQREIGINRRTVGQDEHGKWQFDWVLTIYMHPAVRAEIPIVERSSKRGAGGLPVAPAAARKFAERLDKLAQYERDWFTFHNFALHAENLDDIVRILKNFGFTSELR